MRRNVQSRLEVAPGLVTDARTVPVVGANFFRLGSYQNAGSPRGIIGLTNLGNTGWMNSALQCIRSIEELAMYFLQGNYKQDINAGNPLGYGGDIARVFASVVEAFYLATSSRTYSPRSFKDQIGRATLMYAGYQQHDAQEFLGFLLDALHEDLNRVKKKPYFEMPESDENTNKSAEAIQALGEAFHTLHKLRNDSIVMDLMNGAFRTTKICHICRLEKVTFEPYSMINLSIPTRKPWKHTVRFVPYHGKLWDIEVNLDQTSTIKDLKEYVSQCLKVERDSLMVSEVFRGNFYRHFWNNDIIEEANINKQDKIWIYQLDGNVSNLPSSSLNSLIHPKMAQTHSNSTLSPSDQILVPILHRLWYTRPNSTERKWTMQLWPSFMLIHREEVKKHDSIRREVLCKVFQMSTNPKFTLDDIRPGHAIPPGCLEIFDIIKYTPANDEGSPTAWKTMIPKATFPSITQRIYVPPSRRPSFIRGQLQQENVTPLIQQGETIILEWTVEGYDRLFNGQSANDKRGMDASKFVRKFTDEKLLSEATRLLANKNPFKLAQCFKETFKSERLSGEMGSYCDRCKAVQSTGRTLALWTTPDVLICHLKRIDRDRGTRNKIEESVEFPLKALNLNYNIEFPQDKSMLYDLFAVVNHQYTSPLSGIYWACAKNLFDKQWYNYNGIWPFRSHFARANICQIRM